MVRYSWSAGATEQQYGWTCVSTSYCWKQSSFLGFLLHLLHYLNGGLRKGCLTALQTGLFLGDKGYVLTRWPFSNSQLTVPCAPAATESTMCVLKGCLMCGTAGRKLLSRATVKIHIILQPEVWAWATVPSEGHTQTKSVSNSTADGQLTVQLSFIPEPCSNTYIRCIHSSHCISLSSKLCICGAKELADSIFNCQALFLPDCCYYTWLLKQDFFGALLV